MLLNASLKYDDDIQRQVKSIYCAANKFRSTFDQCSPAGKTLSYPLRVNICFANCQLWNKYTQTSAKHLRAYNNAYRIMHYMPRIVSVSRLSPHQVNNCVRTFDALLRNNFYLFLTAVNVHITSLSDCFKCMMLFTNLHFSSTILTLLYDGDQLK